MIYKVTINDKLYEVEIDVGNENKATLLNVKTVQADAIPVSTQNAPAPADVSAPAANLKNIASSDAHTAPMPGIIVDIKVTKGQRVKENDLLLILEAMKMENEVFAKKDGTVADIYTSKGTQVNTDDPLILIV